MNARLLGLDAREGFRAIRSWLIAAVVISIVFAGSFVLSLSSHSAVGNVPITLGNLAVNLLAGMLNFLPGPTEIFRFPVSWAITLLLLAYLTLGYPYRDLMGFGQKVLCSGGSRWKWWLSKCAWVILTVLAFWGIVAGTTALISCALGGGLDLSVSEQLPQIFLWDISISYERQGFALFLAGIPLATAALCLFQLFLSLVLRPTISYLVTVSILFLSAFYYQSPLLIGNYLMALRTPGVVGQGFPPAQGILISLVGAAVSIVLGGLWFSRMDILEKEY